jgi:C_GCAxxG_C_C family probable redox protein
MNRIDTAVSTFTDGFSCSQAVFSAFASDLGLDTKAALKVSGAFGGGMAGLALTCGAVTGALMVIGALHGRTEANDTAAKEKTYELSREFIRRFTEHYGSIECRALLGVDISTPEGRQRASEENLTDTLCTTFVRSAAEIIEEIL